MTSPSAKLKEDALQCLLASIAAVDPVRIVKEHLSARPPIEGSIYLAGIGKAAGDMAAGARSVLGDKLKEGILVAPEGVDIVPIPGIEVYRGGHPVPNDRGVEGAEAIFRMAEGLGENDFLLCLISGGGSALMTLPPEGITLQEVRRTTDLLLRAGATIQELNCVRKHLDRLKGGRLARIASPAKVLALVLSDVIGDPLDVIASGPLSPDPTTFSTAIQVLRSKDVWNQIPPAVQLHLEKGLRDGTDESPKEGDSSFRTVEVRLVGNNRIAADAARREAERRGYQTRLLSTSLRGEAREVGRVLASLGREMRESGEPLGIPGCLIAAGETTVNVKGEGSGGRNQELVLGAALELAGQDGIAVGSIGTDGIDGPTDAAGAVIDGTTIPRALLLGLDPNDTLARNDAYPFFQTLGDLILTGPTGTNVMDIQVVMVGDNRI